MSITVSESKAINLLRLISIICIVICHILQFYKSMWCQIFNIGVQVFWAMSGYLYAKRTVTSWRGFYQKRIRKIYVPYILWVMGIFVVFYFRGVNITLSNTITYILSLQGESHIFARFGIKGLGHLWFLTGLWCCYLSLPFLQYVRRKSLRLAFIVLLLSIFIYGSLAFLSSYYLWIFAFAYFYGSIGEGKTQKILQWSIFIIAILFLCTTTWKNLQNNYYWRLHHIFIGEALLILFVKMSCLIEGIVFWWGSIVKASIFSYYIYLTHMVWIFGPVSILSSCRSEIIGTLMVVVATVISSCVLYFMNSLFPLLFYPGKNGNKNYKFLKSNI